MNIKMNSFDIEKLKEAVGLACDATNASNIIKGRKIIFSMPKEWVVVHIECIVNEILNLSDEWHYSRLLEVYEKLNQGLYEKLVEYGLESSNEEIVETAKDAMN